MQPTRLTTTPNKGALRGLPVQPSVPFFFHNQQVGSDRDKGQGNDWANVPPPVPLIPSPLGIETCGSAQICGHISRIYALQFRKPLKNNDSAPVRDALSSPTQYVFICLADSSEPRALSIGQRPGNRIGPGSLREPRRTGADSSRRFRELRYNCRRHRSLRYVACIGWPSDTD